MSIGMAVYVFIMANAGGHRGNCLLAADSPGANLTSPRMVVDSLQTEVGESRVTVFLAPVDAQTKVMVTALLRDSSLPGDIAYVAPSSWRVPELGFSGSEATQQDGSMRELLHPSTHGNSLSFDQDRLSVVLVEAAYVDGEVKGIDRFTQALDVRPIAFAEFDLASGEIVKQMSATEGQWAGIPVPTF